MAIKRAAGSPSVAGAAPARAAKPSTSRSKTATHSKATVVTETAAAVEVPTPAVLKLVSAENPQEAIAKIAYSYWESRGYLGGDHLDDWYRAEVEYRLALAGV